MDNTAVIVVLNKAKEDIGKFESDLGWTEDSKEALRNIDAAIAALSASAEPAAYGAVVAEQVVFSSANRNTVEEWVGEANIEIRPLSLASPLPQAAQPQESTKAEIALERVAYLETRLTGMTKWLETNQPDVFKRGMWDAINEADTIAPDPLPVNIKLDSPQPQQAAPGVSSELNELLREAEALSPAGSLVLQKVRSARALLSAVDAQKVRNDALPGFDAGELADVAEGLENGYEKTVNVGSVTGEGDSHLETATAYAARFIRAYIHSLQSQPASAGKDAERLDYLERTVEAPDGTTWREYLDAAIARKESDRG